MSNFREDMKRILLKLPTARLVSGGREVLIRCRYCSDSKDPRSAHMYISLPDDNNVMFHNCYKCHTGGIVTHNKILEWGIYDEPEMLIELSKYNKKVLSLEKNRKYRDIDSYKLDNKFITINELSEAKLNYLRKRIGYPLTYEDILKNKIVLNLRDILDTNNIQKFTRDINIVNELDRSFLGFISQDNAFLNMRNLRQGKVPKPIDLRYINYNIFGKFDNTLRYYTLPTEIDLCNPNRIKLHIAEGPLDILSIFYNLRKQEEHSIYSSILGSSYEAIILYFITGMKLINLEIHMYIDNDVSDNVIYKIKDLLKIYHIPFYVHRNIYPGEKDFGVPIERINEQVFKY